MTLNLDAYWMPYTGNRQFKRDPRIIQSAQGVWFTDSDGRQVLDGHSGLWTTGLGHARPEITEAVSRQMAELDFCPPFQFGHPKAFELATKIADLMPGDLNHVFYTNSGSESADTSLKMARAYWQLKGETRKTRFIGREKGYHGVNYGGWPWAVSRPIKSCLARCWKPTIYRTRCCQRTPSRAACPVMALIWRMN